MKKLIGTHGVAAIIADVKPLQFYKGGTVFNGQCSQDRADNPNNLLHAMAIVGYTPTYYLIRNSWDSKNLIYLIINIYNYHYHSI